MEASYPDGLADLFAEALAEIVSTVSGFSLRVLSAGPDDGFEAVAAFVSLGGEEGGTLFISAAEADLRVLCAAMTAVRRDEVTAEDARDALCELVNMTAGNVKLRLGKQDGAFTPSPLVISGEGMSLAAKRRNRVLSRLLGGGEIALKLKITCPWG